ncbi:MAG TPA: PDZ domain-containing protein [Candidatus Bathyarchaeota archaeon]|nr:PDZ domain-containing protein [Candidatus Bathyarchaeota archaeon]
MTGSWAREGQRNTGLWVIVVVLMVLNVGVLAYTTLWSGSGSDAQLKALELELRSAQRDIESLKEEIRILDRGESNPDLGVIEIYNRTKFSVVLIETPTGAGSGWVYDEEGHIITNNHVVQGYEEVQVTFQSGEILEADVVGTDPYSDMAVIGLREAPPGLLRPLPVGRSSTLLVGETVIAIGNPFGLANTLTVGVISATGRQMTTVNNYAIVDVIQTDAAINPGNSGGPLLNLKGEVVGMNTAIISNTRDFSGIGFAIPSDTITREVGSLIENGTYQHPWLGISGLNLTPDLAEAMGLDRDTRGTLVVDVLPGGPADQAGIRGSTTRIILGGRIFFIGGDIIIGVDGVSMPNFYDLQVYLTRNTRPGQKITLTIIRGGEAMDVEFTLGVRPPP